MGPQELEALLHAIRDGRTSVEDGLVRLAAARDAGGPAGGGPASHERGNRAPTEPAPTEPTQARSHDLGHSLLDLERETRCGHPEVVYGEGKSPAQLVEIGRALVAHHGRLLVTRLREAGARALLDALPGAVWHEDARALTVGLAPEGEGEGLVLVVSAGTSDRAVAEEARVTARMLGARAEHVADVGVAGLHRLLGRLERLREARVLIVVAGMEGALPSVVGGLVDAPILAVPTSVGYGASLGGVAALLAMLNSCASGISVVNIDNGFGAGFAAARINRLGAAGGGAQAQAPESSHPHAPDARFESGTGAAPNAESEANASPTSSARSTSSDPTDARAPHTPAAPRGTSSTRSASAGPSSNGAPSGRPLPSEEELESR